MRILFILIASLAFAETCIFSPPSGWEKAPAPPADILIGYLGKGSTQFRPSITLASEEVELSLKDYAKAVKQIHLEDPNIKLRDLGKFNVVGGEGRLMEITSFCPCGEVKMLQALFVQGSKAYILTAAVLKKDFAEHQAELLKSLRSMTVTTENSP